MTNYHKDKHLATIKMMEAYALTTQAYYHDPSETNLAAHRGCKEAMQRMLESYYIVEEIAHGKIDG